MGSVIFAARVMPEGLEEVLAEGGFLDGGRITHVQNTAVAISKIKAKPADLVVVSTTCPGAEPHFGAVHAAIGQKGCRYVIVAINNCHLDMTAERQFYQSMGVDDVVTLPNIVQELPNILQELSRQRDAS